MVTHNSSESLCTYLGTDFQINFSGALTDYTSKGSAALSFGYVSNSHHFMLSDRGCDLVRKGIFALLLVSHFSFQAFSPPARASRKTKSC